MMNLYSFPDPLPERFPAMGSYLLPSASINPDKACEIFYKFIYLDRVKIDGGEGRQLKRLKENFDHALARALFDYLAMMIAGELRHAPNNLINYRVEFDQHHRKYFYTLGVAPRYTTISNATFLHPQSIIEAGKELFSGKYKWCSSIGGLSWYKISSVADLYKKISDEGFIDRVFNVIHCGGRLFDRGIIFKDEMKLREFLEYRSGDPDKDWNGLQLVKVVSQYMQEIKTVLDYKPFQWGDERLEFTVVEREVVKKQDEEKKQEEFDSIEEDKKLEEDKKGETNGRI